jgi:hypothetical protein
LVFEWRPVVAAFLRRFPAAWSVEEIASVLCRPGITIVWQVLTYILRISRDAKRSGGRGGASRVNYSFRFLRREGLVCENRSLIVQSADATA